MAAIFQNRIFAKNIIIGPTAVVGRIEYASTYTKHSSVLSEFGQILDSKSAGYLVVGNNGVTPEDKSVPQYTPFYSLGIPGTGSPTPAKFGRSVATNSDYTAISDRNGYVQVRKKSDNYNSATVLVEPEGVEGLGVHVELTGNRVIVNDYSGNFHVYNAETGSFIRTITPPEDAYGYGDLFDVSGDLLITSRFQESGASTVYILDIQTGNLVTTLTDPGADLPDYYSGDFGINVSISGPYAAVTAPSAAGGGRVYIYNTSTGAHVHTIINPDAATESGGFGWAVSLSDGYLAVGAPEVPLDETYDTFGKFHVYNAITGQLYGSEICNINQKRLKEHIVVSGKKVYVGNPTADAYAGNIMVYDIID